MPRTKQRNDFDDDDDAILQDGGRLRVPLYAMDSVQRGVAGPGVRVTDAFGDPGLGLRRPGFRVAQVDETARRKAYADYDANLISAYRNDAAPPGAYPLSAGEGNACTINGAPGHLERKGDWLVCRPDANNHSPSSDATYDARASAYAEYDRQLADAWRSP